MDTRVHCREKAFFAFGTARIFERRLRRINDLRNWITYLGIVVPMLIGGVAMSFDTKALPYVIIPAGLIGLVQLALSAWSLVAKWDDRHAFSLNALQAHTKLFNEWDALAKNNPPDIVARAAVLDVVDREQEAKDMTQMVTKQEKNYGMRSALFQFGNECATCRVRPTSLKPSGCDTCGNF